MVLLPPPVVQFDGPPPSANEICQSITRSIGSPVRIAQDAPEQSKTHFKGRIASACVPEVTVAMWEIPPGYEKRNRFQHSIESPTDAEIDLDWEVADALPDRTEAWTLVLVQHGASDDTLIDATIVALESLGGNPRWPLGDETRIAASRQRNEAELRRAYRKAKSESRFLTAATLFGIAGYLLILAIVAIPAGLFLLAAYCVGAVRDGYRSA